jgi:hypothetical protein
LVNGNAEAAKAADRLFVEHRTTKKSALTPEKANNEDTAPFPPAAQHVTHQCLLVYFKVWSSRNSAAEEALSNDGQSHSGRPLPKTQTKKKSRILEDCVPNQIQRLFKEQRTQRICSDGDPYVAESMLFVPSAVPAPQRSSTKAFWMKCGGPSILRGAHGRGDPSDR